jgi:hypothetical protein
MAERKDPRDRAEPERVERRGTEESRQQGGSSPPGRPAERALDIEPGVEQHAGEDAGQVPRDDEQDDLQ